MKRLYNLTIMLLLLVVALPTMAQSGMSVESFTMAENDMTARVLDPRTDQNNQKAALIRIQTTEKDLAFETGMLGIVDTDYSQVGEVWVYVPKGLIRMKIKSNILGVLEYEFPLAIVEATVYNLKLVTSKMMTIMEQDAGGQYLRLTTSPAEVEITINGGTPQTITGGSESIFLPYGDHSYSVRSSLYKSSAGRISIGSEAVNLNVALEPNFGYLDVTSSPSGADVEINGRLEGKTPYSSDRLILGEYTVRVTAPNHAPMTQTVNLTQGTKRVAVNNQLASYFSQISISCPMAGVDILINGERKGTGSWNGELLPGTYEVRAAKDGHRTSVRQLVVEPTTPQKITLNAPTPMYGKLNISSEQGVMVSIDGIALGEAPNIFSNVLAGQRRLVLSKSGFVPVETRVEIEEGKITAYTQGSMMSVEESEEYQAAKRKAEAEAQAARQKAEAEEAERTRWKRDFTHAWGIGLADMDFAGGAFSYTLPMLNLSVGTFENSVCFGTGLHYRMLSGWSSSSNGDYLPVTISNNYDVYDIDEDHLPYLKAHQFVVPLYMRFNIAEKSRRLSKNSHPYIDLGISVNLNVSGKLKRDCLYNDESGDYSKADTFNGFSESITNPVSLSTITKIGLYSKDSIGRQKQWWDLSFTIRYDLSPTYNMDAINTTVNYYGSNINFYESYDNIRNQIDSKLYFGFSWAYFWSSNK